MDSMQERITVLTCQRNTLYSFPAAQGRPQPFTLPFVHLGLVATITV
jgi:hypothetical protein